MATASGNSANLGWKKRSLCLPCKGSRPRCSQLREFAGSGARRKRLSPREPVCRRHPLSAGSVEPDAHREGERSHPQGHRCPAPATRAGGRVYTRREPSPPPPPHRCPGRVPDCSKASSYTEAADSCQNTGVPRTQAPQDCFRCPPGTCRLLHKGPEAAKWRKTRRKRKIESPRQAGTKSSVHHPAQAHTLPRPVLDEETERITDARVSVGENSTQSAFTQGAPCVRRRRNTDAPVASNALVTSHALGGD